MLASLRVVVPDTLALDAETTAQAQAKGAELLQLSHFKENEAEIEATTASSSLRSFKDLTFLLRSANATDNSRQNEDDGDTAAMAGFENFIHVREAWLPESLRAGYWLDPTRYAVPLPPPATPLRNRAGPPLPMTFASKEASLNMHETKQKEAEQSLRHIKRARPTKRKLENRKITARPKKIAKKAPKQSQLSFPKRNDGAQIASSSDAIRKAGSPKPERVVFQGDIEESDESSDEKETKPEMKTTRENPRVDDPADEISNGNGNNDIEPDDKNDDDYEEEEEEEGAKEAKDETIKKEEEQAAQETKKDQKKSNSNGKAESQKQSHGAARTRRQRQKLETQSPADTLDNRDENDAASVPDNADVESKTDQSESSVLVNDTSKENGTIKHEHTSAATSNQAPFRESKNQESPLSADQDVNVDVESPAPGTAPRSEEDDALDRDQNQSSTNASPGGGDPSPATVSETPSRPWTADEDRVLRAAFLTRSKGNIHRANLLLAVLSRSDAEQTARLKELGDVA